MTEQRHPLGARKTGTVHLGYESDEVFAEIPKRSAQCYMVFGLIFKFLFIFLRSFFGDAT